MIEVDIVTPARRMFEGVKVDRISLPTSTGAITVLPGHTELVTVLSTGIMSYSESGHEKKFAVSYGFCIVRKGKVIVLAETCEEANQIDLSRAKAAQKKAEEALAGVLTEDQMRKYRLKLERALIRQQARA